MHFEPGMASGGNTHHYHMTFSLQRHFCNQELTRAGLQIAAVLSGEDAGLPPEQEEFIGLGYENPDAFQQTSHMPHISLTLTVE